jgi:hypothetical protein
VQLDINNQFALFFNEKRPFFLEGSDFFQGPLQTVYSRSVADPSVGMKITGRVGDSTIGAYMAQDEVTNLIIPGAERSDAAVLSEENRAGAFRYRYNVGETSSIGAILTTREGGDYSNDVFGLDGTFRVTKKDTITGQFLGSRTRYPLAITSKFRDQPTDSFSDVGARLQYRHNSRNWYWTAQYDDIGTDFRADAGFIPQVGHRFGLAGFQYTAWGEKGKTWYTRWFAGGDYDRTEKQNGDLLEKEAEGWAGFQGPMQSFAQVSFGERERHYQGFTFDEQFLHWSAEIRPIGDLFVFANGTFADQIDFANTQAGERFRVAGGIRWNLGKRTKIDLDQSYEDLDVADGKLFSADVTQLRAVYNFNIRTFVRAILQYTDITRDPLLYKYQEVTSSSRRLFPQLLFSYKLNPQTVFFAGYSGTRLGGTTLEGETYPLTEAGRTFFLKVGYAWLF